MVESYPLPTPSTLRLTKLLFLLIISLPSNGRSSMVDPSTPPHSPPRPGYRWGGRGGDGAKDGKSEGGVERKTWGVKDVRSETTIVYYYSTITNHHPSLQSCLLGRVRVCRSSFRRRGGPGLDGHGQERLHERSASLLQTESCADRGRETQNPHIPWKGKLKVGNTQQRIVKTNTPPPPPPPPPPTKPQHPPAPFLLFF